MSRSLEHTQSSHVHTRERYHRHEGRPTLRWSLPPVRTEVGSAVWHPAELVDGVSRPTRISHWWLQGMAMANAYERLRCSSCSLNERHIHTQVRIWLTNVTSYRKHAITQARTLDVARKSFHIFTKPVMPVDTDFIPSHV